ncbi:GTP cyclohydrolase 1 type 2 [Paraglaciecola mesophila]|uniref:GTP cyclohydrolase 1 type 2 homolog n=1 Tax=Paraglaciecola mesophila TaxID=197222 RepID=A0A857JG00_9ALTE|nr:Nif3-like dinuclear metal center hexameric protein [Paraglaciecola mesophila]QHJ10182.1 GTP cyclohydrolase 1 type 2 [Paraglaciecola mesophila]
MSMNNLDLLDYFNTLLMPEKVKDFCPNGLQIEGKSEISKVICGVTASQALIDRAIALDADAIFVHHGFFWKGEAANICGMKKKRIAALLKHDINLYAYHLPLDIHPVLGNNAQLGKLLNVEDIRPLNAASPEGIVMQGTINGGISGADLKAKLNARLGRQPLLESPNSKLIHTLAWCTGGGQGYIEIAAQQGIDAFITGEVSEQTIHTSREMNIHFYAAGHHATERYGSQAVAEHLRAETALDVIFVDIPNPA